MKNMKAWIGRTGLAALLAFALSACGTSLQFDRLDAARIEPDASNIQGTYANSGNIKSMGEWVAGTEWSRLWMGLDKLTHSQANDVVMISANGPATLEATLIRNGKKVKSIPLTYHHRGRHLCLREESSVRSIPGGFIRQRNELHLGVTSQGNLLKVSETSASGYSAPFPWGTSGTSISEFPRIK
jgi:hypothetical protein